MELTMNDLFFKDIEIDCKISEFVEKLEQYSDYNNIPVYVIKKALGAKEISDYNFQDYMAVLIPKHKIMLINYDSQNLELFLDTADDFVDDLGYLAKKYGYEKAIGRFRNWESCIEKIDYADIMNQTFDEFLNQNLVPTKDERKVELLISLLIRSINDIDKVGVETPSTLLDKVKKKIILFDGLQSRFIFEEVQKKCVTIQGLAGTGKTELLLHKLLEIYMQSNTNRIVFTCFNKVLAKDMKNRIPKFFNFMKVDEQIEWNEKLFVFSSWGSQYAPLSGMYAYICNHYRLSFMSYSPYFKFDMVCKQAIQELKSKDEEIEPCFDYVFIDESQDFTSDFIELCSLVTKEKIFIAGDIFQDVFDIDLGESVNSDYLLNKCYRTDPKTLMFAHAVGMGLYETPVIRWLDDREWKACGYIYKKDNMGVTLTRNQIRRFEDFENNGVECVALRECEQNLIINKVIESIDEIIQNNSTVEPDDIAIVFTKNNNINYSISDQLAGILLKKYQWMITKGYIKKEREKGKLFVSNVNNIKGLEFPFVICIESGNINRNIKQRNSIYMILTRSFITSYIIINSVNRNFIDTYKMAAEYIMREDCMVLREPGEDEIAAQLEKIKIDIESKHKSAEDIIDEVLSQYPDDVIRGEKIGLYNLITKSLSGASESTIRERTKRVLDVLIGESE